MCRSSMAIACSGDQMPILRLDALPPASTVSHFEAPQGLDVGRGLRGFFLGLPLDAEAPKPIG